MRSLVAISGRPEAGRVEGAELLEKILKDGLKLGHNNPVKIPKQAILRDESKLYFYLLPSSIPAPTPANLCLISQLT